MVGQLVTVPIPSPASGFTYEFDPNLGVFKRSTGSFGPWSADEPGDTPLAGEYTFDDADLGAHGSSLRCADGAAVHRPRQGMDAGIFGIFGRRMSGIGRSAALPLSLPPPMLGAISKTIRTNPCTNPTCLGRQICDVFRCSRA